MRWCICVCVCVCSDRRHRARRGGADDGGGGGSETGSEGSWTEDGTDFGGDRGKNPLANRSDESESYTESEYSGGSDLFGSDPDDDDKYNHSDEEGSEYSDDAAPLPPQAPPRRPTDLKSMLEDTLRAKPGDASAAEEEERCVRTDSCKKQTSIAFSPVVTCRCVVGEADQHRVRL